MKPEKIKKCGRLLWLTDTYEDHNGVSMVLNSIHEEICKRNIPIDILITSNTIQPDDHLIVVKPLTEFILPLYRQQPIRVPNYHELKRIFIAGNYTRIISSTEGPMGMAAIYLKRVFGVKTYFYLHTDWIMFAKSVMRINNAGLNQISRILRFFYRKYDGIFVLNTEQKEWLSSEKMNMGISRVFLTAHWTDESFRPGNDRREELFKIDRKRPVLLYAGRLSLEKGVRELPELYRLVRQKIPDLELVIAGQGPAGAEMERSLPGAKFLGWVDHAELPAVYSAADLLILPSRFDTFSCVVLEAISCGLPVIAYDTKGPADILEDELSGFLVKSPEEMSEKVIAFFSDAELQHKMKVAARKRSEAYEAGKILNEFIYDIGLCEAS